MSKIIFITVLVAWAVGLGFMAGHDGTWENALFHGLGIYGMAITAWTAGYDSGKES